MPSAVYQSALAHELFDRGFQRPNFVSVGDLQLLGNLPWFERQIFLTTNQVEDPFFLYFPLPAPHTPILPTDKFKGKSGTNPYGDFVLQVDHTVGEILQSVNTQLT